MSKIKLIYHSGYWDGPLSGACQIEGMDGRFWFNCVHDYHQKTPAGADLDSRIFGIYRLSEEEWKSEDYWHNLFRTLVGTHTEYDDNGRRKQYFSSKENPDWEKYYDEAGKTGENREPKILTDDNLIGYFDTSDFNLRKEKFRSNWKHGESPRCVHRDCEDTDFVEYRHDAYVLQIDGEIKWVERPGWAIKMADGDESARWWMIKFCPWCGAELPHYPPTA